MKAYQVFARMKSEQAVLVLNAILDKAPATYTQAVAAASATMKARPQFLMKQSKEKRAQLVRRALSRVAANPISEEILATYFLEVRRPLLIEWLDQVGVEHEDGILANENPPVPEQALLEKAVTAYQTGEDPDDRRLLLEAFASQSAIDWPELDALLEEPETSA